MASESPGSVNTLARNNQSKVRTIYTVLEATVTNNAKELM